MKLTTIKQIEIEIKDNDTCSDACLFWVERADDMCSLYELKSINGLRRLKECKNEFGIIDKNGYICGGGWKNSKYGNASIISTGFASAGLTFDG